MCTNTEFELSHKTIASRIVLLPASRPLSMMSMASIGFKPNDPISRNRSTFRLRCGAVALMV